MDLDAKTLLLNLALLISLSACGAALPSQTCLEPLEVVEQVDGPRALLNGPRWWQTRWVARGELEEGMVLLKGHPSRRCAQAERRTLRALRARLEGRAYAPP